MGKVTSDYLVASEFPLLLFIGVENRGGVDVGDVGVGVAGSWRSYFMGARG